jgi:outer membrane protein assembly factor BamD (BamD/ComL family)
MLRFAAIDEKSSSEDSSTDAFRSEKQEIQQYQMYLSALREHQAGHLDNALAQYERILAANPASQVSVYNYCE